MIPNLVKASASYLAYSPSTAALSEAAAHVVDMIGGEGRKKKVEVGCEKGGKCTPLW
jgi:hypothetical protein